MAKFLIHYTLKTTHPDRHTEFKNKAEELGFCEFVIGYRINDISQEVYKYCQLPNACLWTEDTSIDNVISQMESISNNILIKLFLDDYISENEYSEISNNGGLIEDISVSPFAPNGIGEDGKQIIMKIKNKVNHRLYFVKPDLDIKACLAHQKKIKSP